MLNVLLALILGYINIFAYAPTYFWWCAVISFSGYFALIRRANTFKLALGISLAYFLAYFLNFGAIAEKPYYTKVINIVCALYGLFAVCTVGLPAWLTRKMSFLPHLLLYSALWGLMEWMRGHLLTGLPWNPISTITLGILAFAQTVSIWGIYGITIPEVFVLSAPAAIFEKGKPKFLTLGLALMLALSGYLYGSWRLETNPTKFTDIHLRLVQTNFSDADHDMENMHQLLEKHLELSLAEDSSHIHAFIWPESSLVHHFISNLDQDYTRYNKFIKKIGSRIPPESTVLTGLFRASINEKGPFVDDMPEEIELNERSHGLAAINASGLVGWHAKHHLLPFGEFDPLQMEPQVNASNPLLEYCDFIPGAGPSLITIPELPSFAPAVCFEAIFPDEIVAKELPRPDWILIVSNDHHYQNSHFPIWLREMKRMRAIEQGLPLVRVSNAGTSAIFDGTGRLIDELPKMTEANLDIQLPMPLYAPTLYSQYENKFFWTLLTTIVLLVSIYSLTQKDRIPYR